MPLCVRPQTQQGGRNHGLHTCLEDTHRHALHVETLWALFSGHDLAAQRTVSICQRGRKGRVATWSQCWLNMGTTRLRGTQPGSLTPRLWLLPLCTASWAVGTTTVSGRLQRKHADSSFRAHMSCHILILNFEFWINIKYTHTVNTFNLLFSSQLIAHLETTVDPWTTLAWTAQVHLHMDFFQ